MLQHTKRLVDWFIPLEARAETSNYMMFSTFVFLHLLGPLLGHSVIVFIWRASVRTGWVFWTIEGLLSFFWLMPFLVRWTKSLIIPATLSVQALVMLSLFGAFFFGGTSSPFLPWILIALLLGFFFLADRVRLVLGGVAAQLTIFTVAHVEFGDFPILIPREQLWLPNLLSILTALVYITLMALYYESVMRQSAALEEVAHAHRRRADDLREAMVQAEYASQQKSIFLAKMSHELRTPLNAVIGYSEMLRDDLGDAPGWEEKAADLDRINAAGRHLNALVNEVLDLSRIEGEDTALEYSSVEVAGLIDEVVATVAPLMRVHGNRLRLQVAANAGSITTDALKLRQSLLNLLSNAAKFTSKGVITLTALRRQTGSGDAILIEVRDTGIGISAEGQKRLFSSFQQADQTTDNQYGGTGLGLALTRRFCTSMGGSVEFESEQGVGSSFTIEIPAQPRRAAEGARAGRVQSDAGWTPGHAGAVPFSGIGGAAHA